MKDIIEVVRLVASQKSQAAKTLARAFQEDPMFTYIFPDADQRRKSLAWQWEAVIGYSLDYGEVYTTPDVDGVACWLKPGNTRVTVWRMIRTGIQLQRAFESFRGKTRRVSMEVMSYLDQVHERLINGPHWYLWALGVDPIRQGQGIGGQLIQPILALADQASLPCYLETLAEQDVAFYQKYGFDVSSAGEIPGHGLKAWMMRRKPLAGRLVRDTRGKIIKNFTKR
jgi:ribosomal protein S18 acetylase RimI-like enzyme